MKIKWYGHACFRIEGYGINIVTDPYTPEVAGLDPVDEPADVVIMSSATDKFHSYSSMVTGDPKVLNALEIASRESAVEVNGVVFEALPTMESLTHKERPGLLPTFAAHRARVGWVLLCAWRPAEVANPSWKPPS
jgi:hypothetical protein